MKKHLVKEIIKLNQSLFWVKEGFFFFRNFDDVLSGFCCEVARDCIYINWLMYPLFERIPQIHLSYGYRIKGPEGYIDFNQVEKKYIPEHFTNNINAIRDSVMSKSNVYSFVEHIQKTPGLLTGAPVCRRTYAAALIKSGNDHEALKELELAVKTPLDLVNHNELFFKDVGTLKTALENSREDALSLINQWEEEKLSFLGIQKNQC